MGSQSVTPQEMADAMPAEGSDGRRLRRARRIGMEIDTSLGKAMATVRRVEKTTCWS